MQSFKRIILLGAALMGLCASAQERVSLRVDASRIDGQIDPLIYGQLFEHIYFSANNGVWQ